MAAQPKVIVALDAELKKLVEWHTPAVSACSEYACASRSRRRVRAATNVHPIAAHRSKGSEFRRKSAPDTRFRHGIDRKAMLGQGAARTGSARSQYANEIASVKNFLSARVVTPDIRNDGQPFRSSAPAPASVYHRA